MLEPMLSNHPDYPDYAAEHAFIPLLIKHTLWNWRPNVEVLEFQCTWKRIFAKLRIDNNKYGFLKMVRSDVSVHRNLRCRVAIVNTAVRLHNEYAALNFVRENIDIPVPAIIKFSDQGASPYLVTEFIDSRCLEDVQDPDDFETCMKQLGKLRRTPGRDKADSAVKGFLIPPARLGLEECDFAKVLGSEAFKPKQVFPFCHGHLSGANVLVHPLEAEVIAIIDWEYAGFYPHRLNPVLAWAHPRFLRRQMVEYGQMRLEKATGQQEILDPTNPFSCLLKGDLKCADKEGRAYSCTQRQPWDRSKHYQSYLSISKLLSEMNNPPRKCLHVER